MIQVKVMLADDTEIASVWMRFPPCIGEYLWLQGSAGERARKEHGVSSFTVTEVAHWVTEDYSPNQGHEQPPIHTIAAYVEPTGSPK